MKLFLKFILALVILLLIAIIGVAVVFDPNEYKDKITSIVKEKTGRQLSIPGDISLSFIPWIGLDLGKVEISNAKGFGKQPFAKMEHLQVRAKFWSLFKLKLEADTIVIEGLKLNLAKNRQGVSNWDDLTKTGSKTEPTAKTTKKTPAKKTSEKESTQNILGALALNGLKIEQAQFNWDDKQTKQKIAVKDVNLSIGELKPDTKIPFNTQFHLIEKTVNAKVTFKSEIILSTDFQKISFYDSQLTSKIKLATFKKPLSPQFNSPLINLNLKQQTFNAKELNLFLSSVKLQTQVTAKQLLSNPHINSRIILQKFNPRTLAKSFAIKLPNMADKDALTQLSAQLDIKGRLNNINLSNLEIELDNTKMIGHAKIKPTPDSSSLTLLIDNINLDRYLAKPVAAKPQSTKMKNTTKKSSGPEAELIPVGLLTAINLDADFKINKIQIKKTHWTNFHVATHSKNGLLLIKPLTMSGYDAKVKADLKLRATKNNAVISGNLDIQKIKAGKLLNDFIGKDKLKGQTTVTASFNTSGLKLSQLKQNLNGNLKLYLKDGTLKGFDLDHQRDVLDAKLRRKPVPKAPQPAETKIASLSASAIIKKGVLNNRDLRAATPLARIVGRGTVDIAKERINYTASVKFTTSTDIKTKKTYEQMSVIPLDIHIGGSFDKPSIKPDFEKVLKTAVKRKVNKQKKKITDKAKKDLENKVKDKLKNLFKF